MHQATVLRYVTLAFIAGVIVASFVTVSSWTLGVVVVFCLVVVIFGSYGISVHGRAPRMILLLACGLLCGIIGMWRMVSYTSHAHILDQFVSDQSGGVKQKVLLVGIIAEDPAVSGDKQMLTVGVRFLQIDDAIYATNEKTLITLPADTKYRYGDQVQVSGSLLLPYAIPGSTFDYPASLARKGVFAVMMNPKIEVVAFPRGTLESVVVGIYRGIYGARDVFVASIDRALPEPHGAFVAGVLIGSRSQLSDAIKQFFARTSTSHIIAVSGYNITIIAEVVALILLAFMPRSWAFWFTLGALFVFMILTGAQASVIRATIMGVAGLLARHVGRLNTSSHTLALAAGIMVALDPTIVRYDVGFQLSFMATVGILFVAPLLEVRLPWLARQGIVGEIFIMTVSAQLCVVPILIYYFKNISLVSLPANLIILPLVPYVMLLGFAAGLGGLLLPVLGQLIGYGTSLVSAAILNVIHFFAAIPWAAVSVDVSWYTVLASYFLLGIIYWYFAKVEAKRDEERLRG